MKRYILSIFFTGMVIALNSCTPFQAVNIVNSGNGVILNGMETSVPFFLDGHPILIRAKLNRSSKDYTFILDTGAFTLIKQEVADELGLAKGLEIMGLGSQGGEKAIQLTTLDSINVGGAVVENCASGVIENDSLFSEDIAGIIGSNFLRFFTLVIDFKEQEILFTRKVLDVQDSIPVTLEVKHGFAPFIPCILDKKNRIKAMIDTGSPVTFLALSLLKNTDEFIQGKAIKAEGSVFAGIGGRSEENYTVQMKRIAFGNDIIENIPVFSHSDEDVQMLIGNDLLSRFKVIIDYPGGTMNLIPNGSKIDHNPAYFGVAFEKKNGKTLVAGFWQNASLQRGNIKVGDEVLKINAIDTSQLSKIDLMAMLLSKKSDTMTLVIKDKENTRFVTLRKEKHF